MFIVANGRPSQLLLSTCLNLFCMASCNISSVSRKKPLEINLGV